MRRRDKCKAMKLKLASMWIKLLTTPAVVCEQFCVDSELAATETPPRDVNILAGWTAA